MTKLRFVCVLTCISAFSALAMPSRSSLQKVQGAVAELMAEDMAAMKKGKLAPEKAAETALGYAREATDEASKFLFLKGAFGLFVQGRKYDEAVQAIETLTREVKDVPDKVLADIIREKLKRVPKKDGGAVFELYDRVDRRMRSSAERAKLEAALKANPKDADARRQLAFAKAALGDWAGALGDFALVGGKASDAAKAEQGGKTPEAADLWWNLSEDEDERAVLREHAAGLYRQALDGGKLQGIKLSLAKKRVAEFGVETKSEQKSGTEPAAPEPSAADSPAEERRSDPNPIAGAAGLPKPIVIPLKGTDVRPLTFVPIPAGTVDVSDQEHVFANTTVTITRPFLMAKLPIDCAQWKSVMGNDSRMEKEVARHGDVMRAIFKAMGGVGSVVAGSESPAANDFVERLNKDFKKRLPKGMVFRLPTYAEDIYVRYGGRPSKYFARGYIMEQLHSEKPSPEYAWVKKEVFDLYDFVDLLKKAGLKVPNVDRSADYMTRVQSLGIFGEALKRRQVLPTGRKAPNPYGICDAYYTTGLLDRSDVGFRIDSLDCSSVGTSDPLFWTEKANYQTILRSSGPNAWLTGPGIRWGAVIRVVIGPDLVAEWRAKHGK